jgi:predicted nuclease of predicted toxin-antitoxin system
MNFLADESVDQQIADRLRADGHSVVYVAEMDPGIDDKGVLSAANQQVALLITADKGFGEVVRQRLNSKGVVLIRLAGLSPRGSGDGIARHPRT